MKYYNKTTNEYVASRKNEGFAFYCRDINGFASIREEMIAKIKSEVYHGLKLANLTMKADEYDAYVLECDAAYFKACDNIIEVVPETAKAAAVKVDYVCSLINGGHREITITRLDDNAGFRVDWNLRRIHVSFLTYAHKDALLVAMDYFAKCVHEYYKAFGDCYVIR